MEQTICPIMSKIGTFWVVSPLNLYPIIRLSFKKNQFYFWTIRKLQIVGLPAIWISDRDETKLRMRSWMRSTVRKRWGSTFRFYATRDVWSRIVLCIYLNLSPLSRIIKEHYIVVIKKTGVWGYQSEDNHYHNLLKMLYIRCISHIFQWCQMFKYIESIGNSLTIKKAELMIVCLKSRSFP